VSRKKAKSMVILIIEDVVCCDCGGVVETFMIPDKVWDGLGYALGDYACMSCVARRLNPSHPDVELQVEISRQRKRFGLEGVRKVKSMGVFLPEGYLCAVGKSDEMTSVPKESAVSRG